MCNTGSGLVVGLWLVIQPRSQLILNCIFLTDNLEFNYNLSYLDGKAANEGVRGGNTHLLAPPDINNVCCNYLSWPVSNHLVSPSEIPQHLRLKQARAISISAARRGSLNYNPAAINKDQRGRWKPEIRLYSSCGAAPEIGSAQGSEGFSPRRLFDVKVKEHSLYSTGGPACAWPAVIAYDQRSITCVCEMGSGSTLICHFKLIRTFGSQPDETTPLSFNFHRRYITINTLLESFRRLFCRRRICISVCVPWPRHGRAQGFKCRIVQRVGARRGSVLNFLWASSLPVVSLPAQTS